MYLKAQSFTEKPAFTTLTYEVLKKPELFVNSNEFRTLYDSEL